MTELAADRRIYLDVTGMSCGACARRVEKRLNTIDGVRASVDITTKIATVAARSDISIADLCDAVEEAGYHAAERTAEHPPVEGGGAPSTVVRALRWASFGHLGGGAA